MKKVVIVLVSLILLSIPATALAEGGGTEAGNYSWGYFHWVQDYSGWGPACYYGQAVHVVYDATNTWTFVAKDGDVQETLVQNGTATIYDMGGNLLDERTFHVTERFFDAGTDLAIRWDYGTSVWYQASHYWFSPDLEEYQYIWKIPGVYDYRTWNRSGNWSYSWASGDCEDGWEYSPDTGWQPGDWPPRPPHPFSN